MKMQKSGVLSAAAQQRLMFLIYRVAGEAGVEVVACITAAGLVTTAVAVVGNSQVAEVEPWARVPACGATC